MPQTGKCWNNAENFWSGWRGGGVILCDYINAKENIKELAELPDVASHKKHNTFLLKLLYLLLSLHCPAHSSLAGYTHTHMIDSSWNESTLNFQINA